MHLAGNGDDVTDSSLTWPEDRPEIAFGTITLTGQVDDREPERRKTIFDPIPRVDGIDTSGDLLSEVRSDIHLLSGRRRRAQPESKKDRLRAVTIPQTVTLLERLLMADLNPSGDKAVLRLEELRVGQRFVSGLHRIDEEQIRAFARQFDPHAIDR